jgi:hypothetical protein
MKNEVMITLLERKLKIYEYCYQFLKYKTEGGSNGIYYNVDDENDCFNEYTGSQHQGDTESQSVSHAEQRLRIDGYGDDEE